MISSQANIFYASLGADMLQIQPYHTAIHSNQSQALKWAVIFLTRFLWIYSIDMMQFIYSLHGVIFVCGILGEMPQILTHGRSDMD